MKGITIGERYKIRQIGDEEPEPGPGHYRYYNPQLEGKGVSFTKDRRDKFADNMIPGPGSYGKIQDWAPGYGYEMSIPAAAFDEEEHYEVKRIATAPVAEEQQQPSTISRYSIQRDIRRNQEQKYKVEQESRKYTVTKNVIAEESKEEAPSFDVEDNVVTKTYSPEKVTTRVITSAPVQTTTRVVKTSGKVTESESPSKTISQKYSAAKTVTEHKTTAYTKTCKLFLNAFVSTFD